MSGTEFRAMGKINQSYHLIDSTYEAYFIFTDKNTKRGLCGIEKDNTGKWKISQTIVVLGGDEIVECEIPKHLKLELL